MILQKSFLYELLLKKHSLLSMLKTVVETMILAELFDE